MAKEGSTVSGLMDSLATMTSISLQYGVPLRDLVNKFSHMRFEPAGFTGNSEIPIAKSIVDYIFRWMGARFLGKDDRDALGIISADAYVSEPPVGSGAFGSGIAFDAPIATTPAVDAFVQKVRQCSHRGGRWAQSVSGGGHSSSSGGSCWRHRPPRPLERPRRTGTQTARRTATRAMLPIKPLDLGGGTKVAFSVSADSPSCADCGSIMVRNGSCYKCLNCGSTSGCS